MDRPQYLSRTWVATCCICKMDDVPMEREHYEWVDQNGNEKFAHKDCYEVEIQNAYIPGASR